jgi:protocatechuate 3,4-dioxygenase, alpha subunit
VNRTAMQPITPSQTVGPYFSIGLTAQSRRNLVSNTLATPQVVGERIRIEGHVLDGEGRPVNDAMLEIWQADAAGRYPHPADPRMNVGFAGFGRAGTNADGRFWFLTIKPGQVAGPQPQAPHILLAVFARGMLRHTYTRIYFADEPATSSDPVLALVPPGRRATLLATPEGASEEAKIYRFDVRLQGQDETVFLDV